MADSDPIREDMAEATHDDLWMPPPLIAGGNPTICIAILILMAIVGTALVALGSYLTSFPSEEGVGGAAGALLFGGLIGSGTTSQLGRA